MSGDVSIWGRQLRSDIPGGFHLVSSSPGVKEETRDKEEGRRQVKIKNGGRERQEIRGQRQILRGVVILQIQVSVQEVHTIQPISTVPRWVRTRSLYTEEHIQLRVPSLSIQRSRSEFPVSSQLESGEPESDFSLQATRVLSHTLPRPLLQELLRGQSGGSYRSAKQILDVGTVTNTDIGTGTMFVNQKTLLGSWRNFKLRIHYSMQLRRWRLSGSLMYLKEINHYHSICTVERLNRSTPVSPSLP